MKKTIDMPQYVILDFETTGLNPQESEIIEIGALKINGFEITGKFHSLIKPQGKIPELISRLTGITNKIVENSPSLHEVIPEFVTFLNDLPIVAHNSEMERTFFEQHINYIPEYSDKLFQFHDSIDALALILPEASSYSLESLRKWASIDTANSHRADHDSRDLFEVLKKANQLLTADRPQIGQIVLDNLGPSWWWSWFFSESPPAEYNRQDRFENLGDLRKLRTKDEAKEINWEQSVASSEIHNLLIRNSTSSGLEYRVTQEQMSQEIRSALEKGERLAVEAPTGTGKSIAYLLPGLLMARKTGAPLVISTKSKALQDQLIEKDIPKTYKLLGEQNIKATTVKGQDNYICLRKLNDMIQQFPRENLETEERWTHAYLLAYSSISPAAELDRISGHLKARSEILSGFLQQIRSNYLTTIGEECPYYSRCHFFNSARLAHQSDVIIANHALAFHWPAQLPQIRNIIFDEAQHLEDQITEAFSMHLDEHELSAQINRLIKRKRSRKNSDIAMLSGLLKNLNIPEPANTGDPSELLGKMAKNTDEKLSRFRLILPLFIDQSDENKGQFDTEKTILFDNISTDRERLVEAIQDVAASIQDIKDYFNSAIRALESSQLKRTFAADLLAYHSDRFNEYHRTLLALLDTSEGNYLRLIFWNQRESTWSIYIAPIEVKDLAQSFFEDKRTIILTSATLSTGGSPHFIMNRIGLELSRDLISLPSPYPLAEQAVVYIAKNTPVPGTPAHLASLIDFTASACKILGGRTLLLISSNQRLEQAAEQLRLLLSSENIEVFDSRSDHRAAESFMNTERAVLIGGERYGEGLDIPGPALSCVILEKINEAMTRGPLAEARKEKTTHPVYDYDFPLRMIWLKQRIGRLIRSSTDFGTIVIYDSRYHNWKHTSRAHVNRTIAPIPMRAGLPDYILNQISQRHCGITGTSGQ